MIDIKINGQKVPTSWSDIDFEFYEKMQTKTPIEILFRCDVEQIKIDKLVFIEILKRLKFFETSPKIELEEKDKTDIYGKTIEQKLIAQNIIKRNEGKIELSFPYLCAIYTLDRYSEKEAFEETKKFFKMPYDFVFSKGLYIFEQISINNQSIILELDKYKVPKTSEEILAGYDEKLKDYYDFSLIDKLAGGDILKYEQAKQKKLKEVNVWLIYNQRLSYCRYLESEARKQTIKRKSR